MQYILTEQEYKALTPINKVNELEENVRILMIKLWSLPSIHVEVMQTTEVLLFTVMTAR